MFLWEYSHPRLGQNMDPVHGALIFFQKGAYNVLLHGCWLFLIIPLNSKSIGHFTVVLSVLAWIESEAGVDLVLIETSLLFLCK